MSDAGPLHPQVQALMDAVLVEARLSDGQTALSELRAAYSVTAERLGGSTARVDVVEDLDAAGVPVRVYVPPARTDGRQMGISVYAHGGGWMMGDLAGVDRVCRSLAVYSGHAVCSVDYRLAPEDPFPAAVDDVVAVVGWAGTDEAAQRFGHDPRRVAVAGDSAGAGLAAVVSLKVQGIAAQLLIYPALDATMSGSSYGVFGADFSLSHGDMATAYESYLGGADPRHPDVSPLLSGDVTGAPPAYIAVASHDVLHDDGARYAERLRQAGVRVELEDCAGMVHGFIRWGGAVAAANAVIETGGAFLDECLSAIAPRN